MVFLKVHVCLTILLALFLRILLLRVLVESEGSAEELESKLLGGLGIFDTAEVVQCGPFESLREPFEFEVFVADHGRDNSLVV